MKVRLRRSQLDYFRRLARNTDKEIFAYLIGTIDSVEKVSVYAFKYPELAIQTTNAVCPDDESEIEIREEAEAQGMKIVGTIHSHPNWWPVMSCTDHETHLHEGHRISGVCATLKGRTKVYFWVAESSLPCVIEYFSAK